MHPQALPLRSHHFRKVGKKPVLTLVWDPEDVEQEPVQQVRPEGRGSFPGATVPVHPQCLESPSCLLGHTALASQPQAPQWVGTS